VTSEEYNSLRISLLSLSCRA